MTAFVLLLVGGIGCFLLFAIADALHEIKACLMRQERDHRDARLRRSMEQAHREWAERKETT